MFFEGNEKKAEIILKEGSESLLLRPRSYWEEIVGQAGAQILSEISTAECRAFLLSESSLFVWQNRIAMITCGQTTLVAAVDSFLQDYSPSDVANLIYERKNEYFPRLQKTDFHSDARKLKTLIGGQAWQFGHRDEHHLMLFASNQNYLPAADDYTLEILMYDLQGPAREVFTSVDADLELIRSRTQVHQLFSGFQVDDHLFKPLGYSLNALRGSDYYTIHVTPEDMGTYVSFETNLDLSTHLGPALERVLEVFQPRRFDVVLFSPQNVEAPLAAKGYQIKSQVKSSGQSGYHVEFSHYYLPSQDAEKPWSLELE